jgi:sterol desaturase/sphingolipid hydroxylase (fatty acid hydroxylase superfamily)
MQRYVDVFLEAFEGYARYLAREVVEPSAHSYLYGLIAVSLAVYALELAVPWRKNQPRVRRDFWLDAFYMFFNFFLFSLFGYNAVASVVEALFTDARNAMGLSSLIAFDVAAWPSWAQMLLLFVFRDFIHYWVHRLLHRVPRLWAIHAVHHSVRQMGFAAHLRYHLGETIVYRTLEYIPLGLIGFGVTEFFAVHMIALTIGHLNHANLRLPIGPLKYVFNSPQMHIWHHAKAMPRKYGGSFGISLSIWDWLFGTVHWPTSGRDIELGFDGVDAYPSGFVGQLRAGFGVAPALPASKPDNGSSAAASDRG